MALPWEWTAMNHHIVISFSLFLSTAFSLLAFDTIDLRKMGTAGGEEYLRVRDRIVSEGRNVIPDLLAVADDPDADWQLRLAAGTCLERILHGPEIDELDHHDWNLDPETAEAKKNGIVMASDWNEPFTPMFLERLRKAGFWFHYMEFFDGKLDRIGLDPSFKFVPDFVGENATGGVRYFAIRISDKWVAKAFELDTISPVLFYDLLKHGIEDGTYPEGVKTMISGITAKRQMARYRLSKYLLKVSDVEFLRKVVSRLPEGNGNRETIEKRIQELEQSAEVVPEPHGDTSFRFEEMFFPDGLSREELVGPDSPEKGNPGESKNAATKFPTKTIALVFLFVCFVAVAVWFGICRHRRGRVS